ncbi:DUF3024 domain-containing protein [Paenibacillus mucilaginosus]|uniref:DUF3024 domain-containing protein n=2 Tax=Paenibacillus mucilaginosus TaxID=61624 RepID=H6NJD5_9BACL|nr:DUF3024 domain-containing protein [Paenibacillus mucilaginosus]AEI40594.1 hypothetical protein KNP414_02033 [Paenibacillus mucilaginosus KNP414]AFC29214.1 hypothetical protein PM3016_2326 [Paenibacillus mucilaginosus 3016]MCG7216275.1 DUF3024 domain-containing protein [Paenibacillus mucilaginosus]WDM29745.1 DUF3024 domain-containing protein [Paenibacillus mucilaginosus]WFA22552.1 DUF3024 domain-containing protein [Paenibacillus mucilaginosus]
MSYFVLDQFTKKEVRSLPLDAFTKRRIEKIMEAYIESKVPENIRIQIRMNYKIRGNNVTLIEERPAFRSDHWVQHDIAQFRLEDTKWKVYWRDSKNKWHFVDDIIPSDDFEKQLEIVDNDNRGLFWG